MDKTCEYCNGAGELVLEGGRVIPCDRCSAPEPEEPAENIQDGLKTIIGKGLEFLEGLADVDEEYE